MQVPVSSDHKTRRRPVGPRPARPAAGSPYEASPAHLYLVGMLAWVRSASAAGAARLPPRAAAGDSPSVVTDPTHELDA